MPATHSDTNFKTITCYAAHILTVCDYCKAYLESKDTKVLNMYNIFNLQK